MTAKLLITSDDAYRITGETPATLLALIEADELEGISITVDDSEPRALINTHSLREYVMRSRNIGGGWLDHDSKVIQHLTRLLDEDYTPEERIHRAAQRIHG